MEIQKGQELILVKVHTILEIKKILGERVTEISLPERCTVGRFLEEMEKTWGDQLARLLFEPNSYNLLPHINLMVNGRSIRFLNNVKTLLQDGDEILILPPVAGG